MANKEIQPKYLFDLYGVMEVLSSGSNQALSSFADGLMSGAIKIMSAVSHELKDMDGSLYAKFQELKSGRVYQSTTPAHSALQATLMDRFGAGLFGGCPSAEHFESVAICKLEKLELVTGAKKLSSCKRIVSKCCLSELKILSVDEFSAQA